MGISCPAASTNSRPGTGRGATRVSRFMTGKGKAKLISDSDAAYIAGLIDGEGTVTLTRRHRNENRQVCVAISSTERPMLEHVLEVVGVGKITNKAPSSERHAPSFTYNISNRQALHLLEFVIPWLKSYKRERARLILRDYVRLTPRNGKYSAELKAERRRFESEVLALKANP